MEFHCRHTERKRKNVAMGSRAITASNKSSGKFFQISCSMTSAEQDRPDDFPLLLSLRDFLVGGGFTGSDILKLPDFPAVTTRPQKSSTELSSMSREVHLGCCCCWCCCCCWWKRRVLWEGWRMREWEWEESKSCWSWPISCFSMATPSMPQTLPPTIRLIPPSSSSSSPSSTLPIPPSFLPNLCRYLLNSTLNLTPSFAIAKLQKPQNIVSERAITSVQTHQLFSTGSRFHSQMSNFATCWLPYSPSQVSLMVLSVNSDLHKSRPWIFVFA